MKEGGDPDGLPVCFAVSVKGFAFHIYQQFCSKLMLRYQFNGNDDVLIELNKSGIPTYAQNYAEDDEIRKTSFMLHGSC